MKNRKDVWRILLKAITLTACIAVLLTGKVDVSGAASTEVGNEWNTIITSDTNSTQYSNTDYNTDAAVIIGSGPTSDIGNDNRGPLNTYMWLGPNQTTNYTDFQVLGNTTLTGLTVDGVANTTGIDNTGGNITNAGAISGATTISMNGALTGATQITATGMDIDSIHISDATSGINNITGVNTLTATSLGGTLTTAAQGNITSVGTLTSLGVSGATTVGTTLGVTGATTLNGATSINNTLTVNSGGGNNELTVGTNTVDIGSANSTNTILGTTNINTTGTAATTIGNNTAGDITLRSSAASSLVVGDSGTAVNGALSSTGNFSVNTNQFTVDATNGNTAVGGTLGVTGKTTLNGGLSVSDIGPNFTSKFDANGTSGVSASASDANGNAVLGLGALPAPFSGYGIGSYVGYQNTSTNTVYGLFANGSGVNVGYINGVGGYEGLQVTNSQTTLSGGTGSSVLTLNSNDANITINGSEMFNLDQAGATTTLGLAGVTNNTITGLTNTITGATTIQNTAGGLNTVVVNAAGNVSGTTITGTTALNDATGSIGVAINGTASGIGGSYGVRISGTDASDSTTAVAILDGSLASVVNGRGAGFTANTDSASLVSSNVTGNRGLNVNTTPSNTTLTGGTAAVASTLTLNAAAASLLTNDSRGLTATNGGSVTVLGGPSADAAGLTINTDGSTVSLLNNVADSANSSTGHGLTVGPTSTTLSGGTNSSTWTMSDGDTGGATLKVSGSVSGAAQTLISATTSDDSATSALTLGNAGISVNTMTGDTNAMVADNAAADANFINATVGGNTIMAQTSNVVTATTGSNTINANASDQSNTLNANGDSGSNNLMANATTGTNNIEARTNNIGVNTPISWNTIGNTNVATTVESYAGTGYTELNNLTSTMGTDAAGIRTTGGMVQTNATTATIRASNSGTLATNSNTGIMAVGAGGGYTTYATSQNTGTNTIAGIVDNKEFTNEVNGNLFVDGNVYINGTLDYVSSNSANTTVVGVGGGSSILPDAIVPVSAGTALKLKGSDSGIQTVVDGNGKLTNVTGTAAESTASLTLTNGVGNTHGIVVTETQTTMSGGTYSTSLTLNDYGAHFSNDANGAPVKVSGVADGTSDFDAVNYRQLQKAYIGIAAVSALAAIPSTMPGKRFAIGAGYGHFEGENAVAIGMKATIWDSVSVTAGAGMGVGYTTGTWTANAGVSYSF